MKHIHSIILTLGWVFVFAFSSQTARAACTDPYLLWEKTIGGAFGDGAGAVAVDPFGNILVTGYFVSTADFGGISLTSAGNFDIFIAKYSPTGALQWVVRAGSTLNDRGIGIGADASGNVYATGVFQGTINFSPIPLTAIGAQDMYVVKLDPAGQPIFSVRYGNTVAPGHTAPYDFYVDSAGNYAITGEYIGTASFGGANHSSLGGDDIFVARYLSSGLFQWSKGFGSSSGVIERGYGVAIDAGGNTVVTGTFNGTINFGGGNLVASTPSCMFLAKYNTAGTHVWSSAFNGGGLGSDGWDVAVDASSSVIVSAGFGSTINFGGGVLTTAGGYEMALAKFNSAGTHIWSLPLPGTSGENGGRLAVDSSGDIILGGRTFGGILNLGGDPLSAGGAATFYGKFNSAGVHQWSTIIPGADDPNVAVDASRNVLFAGTRIGDVFIRKYGPDTVQPCIASIVDVPNDQGRAVTISFFKSGYDRVGAPINIVRYDAYRRDDPPPAMVATTEATTPSELAALGWEFVGSVPAHTESEYLLGAPTLADSTVADGAFNSTFFIRAATGINSIFYDSEPDSGYSRDNLSPTSPSNFVFEGGTLTWEHSAAPDFAHYSVYGSNANGFATASLIMHTTEPATNVGASHRAFYFVTASDVSGNESNPSRVSGSGTGVQAYTLDVSCYPNPFNPRTTVSYTVPSRGHVTVSVYDVRGSLVTTLVNRVLAAGTYTADWDGRASGASVGTGVYFARIEHNGVTRSKKMVLLK